MAEEQMQNLSFSPEDLAGQERKAKRQDQAGAFASWLNSMTIRPDPNLPAQLQAARGERVENLRKNRTVNMLEQAGQTELANLVKAGTLDAKSAASQMFQRAAEERQFARQKELAGLKDDRTAAMKEYALAARDPDFAKFLALKEPPETPAGLKTLDTEFAKTLGSASGAQALAAARQDAAAISKVLKELESGKELTGPVLGLMPENIRAMLNPESVQNQQLVEGVVQKNLRAILGGQFAMKEGEQLVKRAYNPILPEEQNAARLRALFLSLQTAAENKAAMEDYFRKNNFTLKGYEGPMGVPTMAEFEAAMDAAAPSAVQGMTIINGYAIEEVKD